MQTEPIRRLDTHQAAKLLGCASATLRQSRWSGILYGNPAPRWLKIGRVVRYDLADLERWLEETYQLEGDA